MPEVPAVSGLVFWLCVLLLAVLIARWNLAGGCVQCGGKGGHRADCPRRHDLDG